MMYNNYIMLVICGVLVGSNTYGWDIVVNNHTPYDIWFTAHFIGASKDIKGNQFGIAAGSSATKEAGWYDLTGRVTATTQTAGLGLLQGKTVLPFKIDASNAKAYGWTLDSSVALNALVLRNAAGMYVLSTVSTPDSNRALTVALDQGAGQSIWHTYDVYLVYNKVADGWKEELSIIRKT